MFRILCLVAVTVGIGAAMLVSAAVAAPCGELVLRDWSRDGRVDRTYDLTCYEAAIDDLPSDLRDYSDAEVVITRALASAVREDGDKAVGEGAAVPAATAGNDLPAPLVALGVTSLAVLVAGGVGYIVRRRRDSTGMM